MELGTDDPEVIGLKVSGKATAETVVGLIERLERIQAAGHEARLYIDLTAYEGYDIGLVKEKLAHMGALWSGIERCSYVVEKSWLAKMIGLVDAVTPMLLPSIPNRWKGPPASTARLACRHETDRSQYRLGWS